GEALRHLLLAHGMAAIFHDDGLLVVTLHVRQRFGEDAGDIVGPNGHRGIPGNPAVAPRAATSLRVLASRPPARKRPAMFPKAKTPLTPAGGGAHVAPGSPP